MEKIKERTLFEEKQNQKLSGKKVIESLVSGSLSSTFTTIIYQPLELLKTNIQLSETKDITRSKIIGRSTQSAKNLIKLHGITYLWRGTGASLLRSVPGVGIYYASLNILQTNFSKKSQMPDDSTQAFYFGLTSRSMVSFILAPITVVKLRYESGRYKYPNLRSAIREAYVKNGWVGILPTILRDSIFSGIYYMCYTKLKFYYHSNNSINSNAQINIDQNFHKNKTSHLTNFTSGILSGLIASIVTNPLDVVKTSIQVDNTTRNRSLIQTTILIYKEHNNFVRFFDGLVPRCLRRTLIAASTWTFYEFFMNSIGTRL